MKAESDSRQPMSANAPALGGEGRREKAPRAGDPPARGVPALEVMAKPPRRPFPAACRLRIREEYDRCSEVGEIGRLLRRAGLSSAPLSAWRPAAGLAAGSALTPAQCQVEAAPRGPCPGSPARSASGAPGERTGHRKQGAGRPGTRCRAARIAPQQREQPAAGHHLAGKAGRPRARLPRGGGVPGTVLPPSPVRSRAPAAPQAARPGTTCQRAQAGTCAGLAGERFVDRSPPAVVAPLLDEGQ